MNFSISFRIFTLTGLRSQSGSKLKLFPLYRMASYSESKANMLPDIRQEKQMCVDKDKLKIGTPLKVLSYNILAQTLLERHTELYTGSNEIYLNWEFRKQLIYRELRDSLADVICLQEVEENILPDLARYLNIYGYKYLYKRRTSSNVDGCAMFYLEHKLSLCSYTNLEFFKPNVQQLDRHNIAIVATFSINNTDQKVVLATTHILFNQKRHDIKLMQTQMLLSEIDRQAFIYENNYHPIIITGDFNLNDSSPVYKFITEGYLDLNCVDKRSLEPLDKANTRFHIDSRDLLPPTLGITDQCSYVQEFGKRNKLNKLYLRNRELIEEGTGVVIENMFQSKHLCHNLQLSSVFDTKHGRIASTYHDAWTYVDFIFYNKLHRNGSKILLLSYQSLPTPEQCEEYICNMPNEFCPSDHLPVFASFLLF